MRKRKKRVILLSLAVCLMITYSWLPLNAFSAADGQKININTADSLKLQTLPRIGPKVAQKIIDFRKKHGKFKKIEEIMKVKGIGEKIFQEIKEKITVT
jgi:comEA protein